LLKKDDRSEPLLSKDDHHESRTILARHFINLIKIVERFIETTVLWNDVTKEAHECEHEPVSMSL
jgi:hypothetical protein